jgi:formyltetrahydrofolate deformylase
MTSTTPAQLADTATILVSCPDRRGLVAALGQLLYGHGANIVSADQHTDPVSSTFFQRIVVDLRELHADRTTLEHAVAEVAQRFQMRFRISYGSQTKRVALMVSKTDHCLHDLVLRKRAGEFKCEIPLIVSNHPDLEPIARGYGIPFHVFAMGEGIDKREQEERMLALFSEQRIDLVVLARYMQIVSAEFCARYAERAINIHHSFLPAFVGGKPYHQAHERGVKVVGATAHYVTVDLDEGPILEQDVMRVTHRDSVEDLIRKGRDLERVVLSRAVRYHLEDRVLVSGNKTVVFG